MNQQQQNHHLRMESLGLDPFYWHQIFALDSVIVKNTKIV